MSPQRRVTLVDGTAAAGALYGGPPLSAGLDRRIRAARSPKSGLLALRTRHGQAPPAGFTATLHGLPVILVSADVSPDLSVTVHLEGPGATVGQRLGAVTGTLTGKGITLSPEYADAVDDPNLQTLLHEPAAVAALLLGRMVASADYQLRTFAPALHRQLYERISPHQTGTLHPVTAPGSGSFAIQLATSLSWTLSLAMAAHAPRDESRPLLHGIYAHLADSADRELALRMVRGGFTGTLEELRATIEGARRA